MSLDEREPKSNQNNAIIPFGKFLEPSISFQDITKCCTYTDRLHF